MSDRSAVGSAPSIALAEIAEIVFVKIAEIVEKAFDDLVHGRALCGACLNISFMTTKSFPDFRLCLTQIQLSL